MTNKAYNYNFKMYMEGILVPFKSINIMCTPNGVEASINLLANKEALDLKPKTAVQVFYKEWIAVDGKFSWRLMFDGFLSSYVKAESSTEGRGLSIQCRDFRMDIRKTPAAITYLADRDLDNSHTYHTAGVNRKVVIHGFTPKGSEGSDVKTYSTDGLQDLGTVVSRIAGVAYGKGKTAANVGKGLTADPKTENESALFLDAIVRGVWTESAGGSAMGSFLNRRIRVDKRFMIPSNKTGFEFWKGQTRGLEISSVLLGGAQFSSVEAVIMRIAGMFATRVYSCNTPSLISLEGDALKWVMDSRAKNFLVDDNNKEFGAKYIINETMLLPPLEFTAPPNCNLFFPPMYNSINWQHDMDSDITRGYFSVVDMISTEGSNDLNGKSVQVPNALFKINGGKQDAHKRPRLPLTLEERYKGVSVFYSSVEDLLARKSACTSFFERTFAPKTADIARKNENKLKDQKKEVDSKKSNSSKSNPNLSKKQQAEVKKKTEDKKKEENKKLKAPGGGYSNSNADKALDRHAIIKFLNVKYAGRVVVVDMAFNPYPMSGFPGAIIVDSEAFGTPSGKTIVGMVQQVKHFITISPDGGEASTSVVMNNARMEDEATDVDGDGNPLYMKATEPDESKIDNYNFLKANPEPLVKKDLNNKYYDLDLNSASKDHIYVKDVVTLSQRDILNAKNNAFYLDQEYMPNRIHKFYKEAFDHKEDHFMVSTAISKSDPTKTIKFSYNTMHEGFVMLRKNKRNLLTNYEDCMRFIHRNICSADAFYQGILGLSVLSEVKNDNKATVFEYVVKHKDFKDDEIHDSYFGITTKDWNDDPDVNGLKHPSVGGKSGLMTSAGQFSSINEYRPLTAFIQERRDAVEKFLVKINERVEGVQYSNVQ